MIASGTYKPTDYPPNDQIPAPAPPSPYGTNLSVFNGIDPTGTWSLYVYDDSSGDSGSINGGWTLTITTLTPPVCCGGNSLADLNLVTGSSTTSTGIGSNITYNINVTNLGPNTASDVVLLDSLPSIVSFVSATNSIGTFNNANGIVTFNLGTMTNGARASMSIVVTTTTSGYASNIVTVSSRAADPNPANNSSALITAVSPPAPLALFSASPLSGNPPLAVTFSDGSLGSITNHFWSFGDGRTTNTSATNFVITYSGVGTNSVSLIVSGPGGTNTLSQTGYIVVTNLPPKLVVTPTSLAFGSVQVGQTPSGSFQVVNSGGLPLTGNAAVSLPFNIQSGGSLNLSPGQTGAVVISFSPSTVGNFSNAVVFSSNGGNSTNAVTGSGFTPAQLAVSPQSLNFGTVAVGANIQASFTATNSGSQSLTNGSVSVTTGPFSIISSPAFSIGGFGSTNVVVRFTPASEGGFTNILTVTSQTAGSSTNTVTGAGAIVPLANFVAGPTNGLKPLAVTFTNTSAGTLTNIFWDFGDGSTSNNAGLTVSHIYQLAGTNTVLLSVSGPLGVSTVTRTNYIV